jgi:hypothetical protein
MYVLDVIFATSSTGIESILDSVCCGHRNIPQFYPDVESLLAIWLLVDDCLIKGDT